MNEIYTFNTSIKIQVSHEQDSIFQLSYKRLKVVINKLMTFKNYHKKTTKFEILTEYRQI